jgi:hypothetical protein
MYMPFAFSVFTPSLSQCNPLESLCQYIEHRGREEYKHREWCDVNVQLSRCSGCKNHHVSVSDPKQRRKLVLLWLRVGLRHEITGLCPGKVFIVLC